MNGARHLPARDYGLLKAAAGELVGRLDGPVAAAGVTRVAASLLSRYGSDGRGNETTFAPIDVVADLEAEAGEPIVTRILADLAGCDLVPRSRPQHSADFAAHDTDLTRAACALMLKLSEARADHSLTAEELVQLEALSARLMTELAEFRADAQREISATDLALAKGRGPALRAVRG